MIQIIRNPTKISQLRCFMLFCIVFYKGVTITLLWDAITDRNKNIQHPRCIKYKRSKS